jgi:cold shock CspA family protein
MKKQLAKPSARDYTGKSYNATAGHIKGMRLGMVRSYSPLKGGGTIEPDNDREPAVYFSSETLRACGIATLQQGDKVRYQLGQDPDVPHRIAAIRIEPANEFVIDFTDLPF